MKSSPKKYHIGCSGFYNADWKGTLYPVDSANKDFLKLYSATYDCVEINSTFYRKPTEKTLQKWVVETPDNFKFIIKIPKTISHQKPFVDKREELVEFISHIKQNLRQKLAGFLIQFPPSFHNLPENVNWIKENLPTDEVMAIEFRHASWWDAQIYQLFKRNNWIFCGSSFPGKIPEEVVVTHPTIGYYRLHGKPTLYKSPYPEEYLQQLAEKIQSEKRDFFVMFNNTWGTSAIKNSLYLKKILD